MRSYLLIYLLICCNKWSLMNALASFCLLFLEHVSYSSGPWILYFFPCSWWWGSPVNPPTSLSGEATMCWSETTWRLKSVSMTLCPSNRHTNPGYKHPCTLKTETQCNFTSCLTTGMSWASVSSCFSSLMMCGVLAMMFEHYKEAQTFLERATQIDPPSVVAWTLLGEAKSVTLDSVWFQCRVLVVLMLFQGLFGRLNESFEGK